MSNDIVATILIKAIDLASDRVREVGVATREAGAAAQESSGLLGGFGSVATHTAGTLVFLASAAAAFTMKEAADFNKSTMLVANNTHMTNGQLSQMRGEIEKLGAESPASLDDLAQGFEKAANAGYMGSQAFKIVKASMMAAVETGGDVKSTVNAVTQTLKDFRLHASDAAKVLGELDTAAAQGDIRMPDLVNNFQKVGALAGAMHIPLAQVAAAYSTLTRFTHDAALSQTLFFGMLQHIEQPTKATTAAIQQLSQSSGVDLTGAFAKLRNGSMDLTTFMQTTRQALGLTDTQLKNIKPTLEEYAHGQISAAQAADKVKMSTGEAAAELFAMFGGLRGGLAGLLLMTNGWKDYNEILHKINTSHDVLGQQWARTSQQMGFQTDELWNKLKIMAIAFGTPLITAVTGAETKLNAFGNGIMAHRAEIEQFGKAVATDIGDAARTAGQLVSTAFHDIESALAPVVSWIAHLKGLGEAMRAFGIIIGAAVAAVVVFTAAMVVLNAVMSINPIAAIVVAIAALVAGLILAYNNCSQFRDIVNAVWSGLQNVGAAIEYVVSVLAGWVGDLASAISKSQGFKDLLSSLQGDLGQLGNALHGLMSSLESLISPFQSATSGAKSTGDAMNNLSGVFNGIGKVIQAVVIVAFDALATQIKVVADVVVGAIKVIIDIINTAIGVIRDISTVIGDMVTLVSDLLQGKWGDAWKMAEKTVEDSFKFWTDLASNIVHLFSDLVGTVVGIVKDLVDGIVHLFEDLFDTLVGHSIIPDMINAIIHWFASLPGQVLSIITGMVSSVETAFAHLASSVLSTIGSMIGNVLGKIGSFVGQMASKAADIATDFIHGLTSIISGAVGVIGQMISAVLGAVAGLAGDLMQAGANAGAAFAKGLASAAGAVASAAGGLLHSALGFLGFHSPNAYGDDPEAFGRNFGNGWAKGLLGTIPAVKSAAQQMMAAVKSVVSQPIGLNVMAMAGTQYQAPAMTGNLSSLAAPIQALTSALTGLPPQFETAGQAIISSYVQKAQALQQSYVQSVQDAHTKLAQQDSAARQKEREQIAAAQQKHEQAIRTEDTRHEQALTRIHQQAATQTANVLANFNIHASAEHAKELADSERMEQQYFTRRSQLENQLAAAKTAADRARIAGEIQALDAANKAHLASYDTMLGIHDKEQQQLLNQHLKEIGQQQAAHLRAEDQHHAAALARADQSRNNSIAKAHQNELDAIARNKQAMENHIASLKKALEKHVADLQKSLKSGSSPSAVVSGLDSQTSAALKNATDQLTLDFLKTGRASEADIVAYDRAAQASSALAAAQAQAQQAADRSLGQFSSTISAVSSDLSNKLQNAEDKYTYDLLNHTGDLNADRQAIQQAALQQQQLTNAQSQATTIAQQATASVQSFSQQVQAASQASTDATDRLAQKIYDLNNGIQDNLPSLDQLKQEAIAASNASSQMAAAEQQATAMVQANTSASQGAYNAALANAQAQYDAALAAYENAKMSGVTGAALDALKQSAINAGVALQQIQNIANDIQNGVNAALNPPSTGTTTPVPGPSASVTSPDATVSPVTTAPATASPALPTTTTDASTTALGADPSNPVYTAPATTTPDPTQQAQIDALNQMVQELQTQNATLAEQLNLSRQQLAFLRETDWSGDPAGQSFDAWLAGAAVRHYG